jgi:hypothetical protein
MVGYRLGGCMSEIGTSEQENRDALARESKRIQENSLYNATAHFTSAGRLWRAHLALGTVPIILGTIGGWKGLSDPAIATPSAVMWAGLCSLMAGVVGSVLTFWNLAESRVRHFTAATQYKSLENDARRTHEIHARDEEYADLKRRVVDLGERYNKLNESHVQTADWAFKRAHQKIEAGLFTATTEKDAS